MGGTISAFLFLDKYAPTFRPGHLSLMCSTTMSFVLCGIMTIYLRRENARRDAAYKPPSEYTRAEMELEKDKGDDATFFRYTV